MPFDASTIYKVNSNITYFSVLVEDVNLSEFLLGFGVFEVFGFGTLSLRCSVLLHSDMRFWKKEKFIKYMVLHLMNATLFLNSLLKYLPEEHEFPLAFLNSE